jgi:hypothetical protein
LSTKVGNNEVPDPHARESIRRLNIGIWWSDGSTFQSAKKTLEHSGLQSCWILEVKCENNMNWEE